MDLAHLTKWKPILYGSTRERAIEKIEQIAHYLYKQPYSKIGYGLFTGKTGIALFFYYYYQLCDDIKYLDKVEELLNASIKDMNNEAIPFFSHCDGISGAAWCIDFLQQEELLGFGSEAVFGEGFFDAVHGQAAGYLRQGNFDYLHGAIGLLLFLIDRGVDVADVVDLLIERGELSTKTIKWTCLNQKRKSTDCYNLSLAHGNASILHLFSSILRHKTSLEIEGKAAKLVNFMWGCRNLPGLTFSEFPNQIEIPEETVYEDSRLAWCYGDLGISYLLYRAGMTMGDDQLQETALGILEKSTLRKSDRETFVADAGFCHGTIGIAHIYNRLFNLSGIETFRNAAEFWYARTLAFGTEVDGAVGYKTWRVGGAEKVDTLLEGISGIGLGLISAVSDITPKWDKFMLLD
jgi:lantibiotic biosynthesis protein